MPKPTDTSALPPSHGSLVRRRLTRVLRGGVALMTTLALELAAMAGAAPARAAEQSGGLPVIRDAETEQLLREYTRPLLQAAGLAKQNIQVVIINSRTFNAFVMDGRRIFVNSGALMESDTPNQIIGVMAHEIGHIVGGHLAKLRQQLAQAQTQMILATILGAAALIAGARNPGSATGNIGAAAFSLPGEVARRNILSYVRQQEEAADRAGVRFLTATHQSPKGMYETFKRFADQSMFAAHGADPYSQSHPMPTDRVSALQIFAQTSPYWDKKDEASMQLRHDLMRAKLAGFMDRTDTVARRFPQSADNLPARYARAITTYLHGDARAAQTQIDQLIQSQPNNPYFYELKGQSLLESGRANEAIGPLRRAVQLSGGAPLIEIMLGQALVASNNPAVAGEAINLLKNALAREPESSLGFTQLAMAYGRQGNLAEADLASAQAAYLRGDSKTARDLASRAKSRFPTGSPGWVKADDIVTARPLPGSK